VKIAVHEWLQVQEPDFYHNKIFTLMPQWGNASVHSGIKLKNNEPAME
jgi:hypothetical protein